jgi:hypothetical protein
MTAQTATGARPRVRSYHGSRLGPTIVKYAAFWQLENRVCLHTVARASQGNSNFSNNDQAIERESSSTSIANDMSAPADVAVPRVLFAKVLRRIDGLRLRSPPFPA